MTFAILRLAGGFLRKAWPLILLAALALAVAVHMRSDAKVKRKLDEARAQLVKWEQANEATRKWAIAERAAREAAFRAKAKESERVHTTLRADARTATDRFIADNRVREGARCVGSPAAPEDRDTGVPADVSAPTLVAVPEHDVRVVGELAAYALACRSWALSITD